MFWWRYLCSKIDLEDRENYVLGVKIVDIENYNYAHRKAVDFGSENTAVVRISALFGTVGFRLVGLTVVEKIMLFRIVFAVALVGQNVRILLKYS